MSFRSISTPHHHRRPPPTTRVRSPSIAARTALQLGALALVPCAAGAQELRYSLTPTVERLRFDEALGLENTYLYGGRLGVLFGRTVELQGFYLTSHGTDARVGDLYDRLNLGGDPPQNAGLDLSTYGANLVLNFGNRVVTPFVRGGGSVLRFAPTGRSATERIALQYAGGVRVGRPGGIRLNAFVEDVRFRVDRTLLLAIPAQPDGAVPFDGDAGSLRSNVAYGAGLTIPLGGAVTSDDRPSWGLANISLPVDAFAGVFDWNDAVGLEAQNILGVRTGLDFGPLVGLRAYYWRGIDGDFSRGDGVQSWGAEAQFNLNSGSGVSPFLLGGAGQIDFTGSGVRARGASDGAEALRLRPVDRTALIVGGGVKLPLTEALSLTAAARNYVTTRDSALLQDVNATGQLRSNWQYTAGLSVGIGRRGLTPRAVVARTRTDTVYVDRQPGSGIAVPTDARRGDIVRSDAVPTDTVRLRESRTVLITARGDTLRGDAADSVLGAGRWARARSTVRGGDVESMIDSAIAARSQRADTVAIAPRTGETTYASDRTVPVVVPREGEITIRYGPASPAAAGTSPDLELREEIRAAVRAAMREEFGPDSLRARPVGTRPAVQPAAILQRGGVARDTARGNALGVTREEVRAEIRAAIREALAARDSAVGPATGAAPRTTSDGGATRDATAPNGTDQRTPVVRRQPLPRDTIAPPAHSPMTTVTATELTMMPGASRDAARATEQAARERRMLDNVDARMTERRIAYARADSTASARAAADSVTRARAAADTLAPARAAGERRTVVDEANDTVRRDASRPVVLPPRRAWSYGGTTLYSGATFSGGRQALLGGRFDFGDLFSSVSGLRFVPEIAFGHGSGGTTSLVAANAMYQFGIVGLGSVGHVRPHASIGVGLLTFSDPIASRRGTDVVLNPAYGLSVDPSFARPVLRTLTLSGVAPALLVEHQGVGLFDVNRLVLGLIWR